MDLSLALTSLRLSGPAGAPVAGGALGRPGEAYGHPAPAGQDRPGGSGLAGQDRVEISPEARRLAEAAGPHPAPGSAGEIEGDQEADRRQVEELKARDRQVRAHEQAHLAAAGSLARGGAHFTYETGPDGGRYAVGGEVSIDTSPVDGDPAATIRKATRIRQAALAPADPSPQDRQVAAQATVMASQAQRELAQQKNM